MYLVLSTFIPAHQQHSLQLYIHSKGTSNTTGQPLMAGKLGAFDGRHNQHNAHNGPSEWYPMIFQVSASRIQIE